MRTLALYLVAAVAYIGTGLAQPYFLFTALGALAFLLLVVWALPELVRRLR